MLLRRPWTLEAWIEHAREVRGEDHRRVDKLEESRAAFELRYTVAHGELGDRMTALEASERGSANVWAKVLAISAVVIAVATTVVLIVHP